MNQNLYFLTETDESFQSLELKSLISQGKASIHELCLGPVPIINGKLTCIKDKHGKIQTPTAIHNLKKFSYYIYLQRSSSKKWIIVDHMKYCLSKNGEFLYQPLPSSRDEEFLELTRWDSPSEAVIFYENWKNELIQKFLTENNSQL